MSALAKHFYTPEEYLELENAAEYRSQYVAGEIFAMAGTQLSHHSIVKNLVIALDKRLRGKQCDFYFQEIRLRAARGDMYTYPDLMALCGEPRFEREGNNPPSLLNPQVIIEVLSPSTEAFDRGDKFARYRTLESLQDYVLISASQMRIDHHHLQDNGRWETHFHDSPDHLLELGAIRCEISLAEIYERVEFS